MHQDCLSTVLGRKEKIYNTVQRGLKPALTSAVRSLKAKIVRSILVNQSTSSTGLILSPPPTSLLSLLIYNGQNTSTSTANTLRKKRKRLHLYCSHRLPRRPISIMRLTPAVSRGSTCYKILKSSEKKQAQKARVAKRQAVVEKN